jgi:D-alanyl-D-alanine carboxypeptidase (penicillin-binding protein 5/6)
MLALNFPAFAQIVAMPQVMLPVAGLQYNLDALLGRDGIVGIKTGSTSQAGGCFVFAAHQLVGGRTVTVAGAVLHQLAASSQPSIIAAAFTASTSLLTSVRRVLVRLTVVRRGATLAWVEAPWGERVALRAATSASLVGWPGLPLRAGIAPSRYPAAPLEAGQSLGTVVVAGGEERAAVRLATSGALPGPSLSWRLAHP